MHYIRLVVLGDSQVGKTSLIRQLVGEELKFEPELRLAGKLDARRSDWHGELARHERQVERAVETKRLASLLSSQIELQQLLLQQQRGGNDHLAASTTNGSLHPDRKSAPKQRDSIQEEPVVASPPATSTCQVRGTQEHQGISQQLEQPTILISAISASNRSIAEAALNCNGDANLSQDRRQSTCSTTSASALASSACQSASQQQQLELKRTLSAEPINLTTTIDGQPASCVAQKSYANHVPDSNHHHHHRHHHRSQHHQRQHPPPPRPTTCETQPASELDDNNSTEATQCSFKQKPLVVDTATTRNQHLHLANESHANKLKHRHSYCAPGEPGGELAAAAAAAGSGSNKVTSQQVNIKQQQQQQQQSEISTQAKIISILFTRNEPKSSATEHQSDPAAQQQPSQVQVTTGSPPNADQERPTKSARPLLMPSLLRQYQRRLSNFHQSNASGNSGAESRVGVAGEQSSRPDEASAVEERQRRLRAAAAARAAAQLARAAAAAAQALLASEVPATQSDRVGAACGPRAASLTPPDGSQLSLYALTAECRRELLLVKRHPNAWRPKLTPHRIPPPHPIPSASQSADPIRHFCVNYINNMDLYELEIVDMPTIEPVAFPTSSLLEWSLFRGRSHLLTADAYLLVFDLTRPSTIQYIKTLRDKIFESREMSHVPVYVIANKADLCPTLQPSLQARRLRSVAVRRHQAGITPPTAADPKAGSTAANPPTMTANQSSATSTGGTAHQLGDSFNRSIPSSAAHQLLAAYKAHRIRLGRTGPIVSLRRWATLRTAIVKPPDHPGGIPTGNPQSSAAQWLQFERTRLHYSLIVGAASGHHHGDSLGLSQWSQSSFGRALKRLKSCVGRRIHRLRSRAATGSGPGISAPGWRLSDRHTHSSRHRRRSQGSAPPGQGRAGSRHQRRGSGAPGDARRRRRTQRSRPRRQRSEHHSGTSAEHGESGTGARLTRWFRPSHRRPPSTPNRTNKPRSLGGLVTATLWAATGSRLRLKRKRPDQSESGASRSGSIQSGSGGAAAPASRDSSKRSKPTAESSLHQYSRLLTSAAKQVVGAGGTTINEPQPFNLATNNKSVSLSSDTPNAAASAATAAAAVDSQAAPNLESSVPPSQPRAEPICGAMSTPSSRQRFYDLFNRLLQTSSTAAAKTQLKLGSISGATNGPTSGGGSRGAGNGQSIGGDAAGAMVPPLTEGQFAAAPLLQVRSPAIDGAAGTGKVIGGVGAGTKRRKSSSTGAALWATLSSYALSRTSRSSIGSNQSQMDVHSTRGRDSVTTLTRSARAEHELQQSRRASATQQLGEGLHLGTDTYLSVDMLRKLSLISSHSQTSAGGVGSTIGGTGNEPEATEATSGLGERAHSAMPDLAEPEKSQKRTSGGSQASGNAASSGKRASTATPTGRSGFKQIWYRSVVKKILFQSNKRQSFRAVVTAMELQRRADQLDTQQQQQQDQQQQSEPAVGIGVPEADRVGVASDRDEEEGLKMGESASNGQQVKLERSHGARKQSLGVSLSGGTGAPSIRIITSGSSLSLMSAGKSGSGSGGGLTGTGAANNSASMKQSDGGGGGSFERRDRNNENVVAVDDCDGHRNHRHEGNQQLAHIKTPVDLSAASVDDTNINQDSAELEVSSPPDSADLNHQSYRRRVPSAGSQVADRCVSPLSLSSSMSGSSLSNSVSLSLAEANNKQQQPAARPQSACAALLASQSNQQLLDSITENPPLPGAEERPEVVDRWRNCERLLDFMQQPQVVGSALRKLSADDCLIINRQRRSSSAAGGDEQVAVGAPPSWLFTSNVVAAAAAATDQTRPATAGAADADSGSSDGRRQSVKATVEAAIHLLVPRAKGSRSASITLGVIPAEQRSLSRVGNSIMGAVNVHRTWRDWRQLLGKRKAPTTTAEEATCLADTAQSAAQTMASATTAAAYEPDIRAAGFLSSHWAFARLTADQQREAAINFDQLMRVNQLTLSAANAVMLNSTTSADHNDQESVGVVAARESLVPTGEGPLSAGTAIAASSTKKQAKRNHHAEPLMTRLQSGGNLLLKRASSKRETGGAQRLPETISGTRLSQDNNNLSISHSESHSSTAIHRQNHDERRTEQSPSVTTDTQRGTDAKLAVTEGGVSAQIAAAAASALDKQKRRGEKLSMILEPRYDRKQPGAQYPLFVSNELNPILKDLAQLVRKHWKCNYIECSAASNWNIMPIMSELTRSLECNQQLRSDSQVSATCATPSSSCSSLSSSASSSGSLASDSPSSGEEEDSEVDERAGEASSSDDDDEVDDLDRPLPNESDVEHSVADHSDAEASKGGLDENKKEQQVSLPGELSVTKATSDAGSSASSTVAPRKCRRTAATGVFAGGPSGASSLRVTEAASQMTSAEPAAPLGQQVKVEEVVARKRKVRLHCAASEPAPNQRLSGATNRPSSCSTSSGKRRRGSSLGNRNQGSSTSSNRKSSSQTGCAIM